MQSLPIVMRYLKILSIIVCLISLLIASASNAKADISTPTFASCNNPTGDVQASYPTGDHAIVSVNGLQSGSDQVFTMGSDNYMQCFCPTNGATGIQTNWFAAGGLSQVELNDLSTQGWTIIPNGADWGLSNQTYLAKNINYSCGGGGGTPEGSPTPTSNNSGGPSDNGVSGGVGSTGGTGGPGGDVLGIATLAATSNPKTKIEIFFLISMGLLSICYGIFKKTYNHSKS